VPCPLPSAADAFYLMVAERGLHVAAEAIVDVGCRATKFRLSTTIEDTVNPFDVEEANKVLAAISSSSHQTEAH
jgi:hypothetical protein